MRAGLAPIISRLTSILNALMMIAILSSIVSAARIEGRLYDFSLSEVRNGIVQIDTRPIQRNVAINGSYSFDVPDGNYTLIAQSVRNGAVIANATQMISVSGQGDFVLDLILLPIIDEPSFSDEIDLSDVTEALEQSDPGRGPELNAWLSDVSWRLVGLFGIALLSGVGFLFFRRSGSPKNTPNHQPQTTHPKKDRPDLDALIRALESREGRATQKEIRKDLPFSEAKVSLMVAELEHDGRITKIRKGRGNIIILNV